MQVLVNILKLRSVFVLLILVGVPLFALPATLSLPSGLRPGVEPLTIEQAADELRAGGLEGWDLVEEARSLVAERMAYCRRNSFDNAAKAFARGYGYCQQQSYALTNLLTRLGFEARVVAANQNRFPDGKLSGHAWVAVTYAEETRQIDTLYYDPETGELTFESLSPRYEYTPFFRVFAGWGSASVNAYRYYTTGVDH